jgi:HlyD family secretion protein
LTLASCEQQIELRFPGYVEGKYTYISVNFPGILTEMHVTKGDQVKVGDLLLTIVKQPESDDFSAQENRLKESQELAKGAKKDYDLQDDLVKQRIRLEKRRAITTDELNATKDKRSIAYSNWLAKKNNIAVQEANLRKAQWALNQKTIHSPVSGLVFDTYFTKGELIGYGIPVLSLIDSSAIRVYFYVPETILHKLKLKQTVNVTCDSCSKAIKAEIVYISPDAEYTPPVIYSNDVRTKLVYRIEAIPQVSKPYDELHLGQPTTVTLENEPDYATTKKLSH